MMTRPSKYVSLTGEYLCGNDYKSICVDGQLLGIFNEFRWMPNAMEVEEQMTEKVTTPYYASPQVHEGLPLGPGDPVGVWRWCLASMILGTLGRKMVNFRKDDQFHIPGLTCGGCTILHVTGLSLWVTGVNYLHIWLKKSMASSVSSKICAKKIQMSCGKPSYFPDFLWKLPPWCLCGVLPGIQRH